MCNCIVCTLVVRQSIYSAGLFITSTSTLLKPDQKQVYDWILSRSATSCGQVGNKSLKLVGHLLDLSRHDSKSERQVLSRPLTSQKQGSNKSDFSAHNLSDPVAGPVCDQRDLMVLWLRSKKTSSAHTAPMSWQAKLSTTEVCSKL